MKTTSRQQRRSHNKGCEKPLRTIRRHWGTLQQRYKVKQIGVFGSVARGERRNDSDIDVLVEYEELPDLLEFINLENYLQEILKQKVDLVEKHGVRPELKHRIFEEVVYL